MGFCGMNLIIKEGDEMIIKRIIFILCLSALTLTSCDKNPTKPESNGLSTIIVYFEDNRESTISDGTHDTRLSGRSNDDVQIMKIFTFENNMAVIDLIPPGKYYIRDFYSEYNTEQGYYIDIHFGNYISVSGGKTVKTHFIIPEKIRLKVALSIEDVGPIPGAEISTVPETITAITDEVGYADFGSVPTINYQFIIKKDGALLSDGFYFDMAIIDGEYSEYYIIRFPTPGY
jgi:hypothetical protein